MEKVKFENVTISYGENTVVRNFSLTVMEGEILGVVGPSGCGKTTLVRALCGLINPDAGEILVGEQPVFSRARRVNVPPEKRKIGIVFQDYAVWPHLSVFDNVAYPLKKQRVEKAEIQRRVTATLEQVSMAGYERYLPSQLSGGQQQRVAIARALSSSSDLIVMDEPITNLDAKLRENMLVEIRLLQQKLGATIIYITHDQEAALQLCDKVVILNHAGEICQIGTDEEIIENPANRFVFEFIGVSNFIPVAERDGKYCLRRGRDIPYASARPAGWPDGPAVMGIRPMDMVIDESGPVEGTITQAVFLGNMYNYFVQIGDRQLRVQRSTLDSLDGHVYRENDTVRLRLLNEKYYAAEEGSE